VRVDFTGSAPQVAGNVNCPLAVTAAAVYYVFRCMMPSDAPVCAGLFRPITLDAPDGSVVNARFPAAVAAGNVETSSRLVDLVLRALSSMCPGGFPAASQGTMNNLAMGWHDPDSNSGWDYYETLAGGIGAGPVRSGLSMRHSHMTNTLNTPVERIESVYPLRVTHYGRRRASGGMGRHAGGDGVIREYQFLAKAKVTLLTDRRRTTPWGVDGGAAGMPGCNRLNEVILPGKVAVTVQVGDRLRIETPGGGGFGISPGQLDAPDA
jgi:N-methylhydantoinase B